MTDFTPLYKKIGYRFRDSQLLCRALSHRSIGKKNNERLEFLGDAILGYVIARALYQQFPQANEGTLSRYRSLLVKGETLAQIALEFNLGDYLLLGGGELKSGGFRRASILADALEATIAAISLDDSLQTAERCVLKWFDGRIKQVNQKISKDPKSRLQEFLQARHVALPEYIVTDITGKEHNQTFTIECHIKAYAVRTRASGKSRRQAEQSAAQQALEQLQDSI